MFKRETYLDRLISAKWNGLIKIITAIRRSGKSYLLNQLFYQHLISEGVSEDNIISIALDDDTYELYNMKHVLSNFLKDTTKTKKKNTIS